MIRIFVLALLLAVPVFAVPAFSRPASAQDFDCSNPEDLPQQGMNQCAHLDFEEADRALNGVWAMVRTNLRQQEAEYEGYDGWYDTVLKGQRAWIVYRDAQCEAEGKVAEGGSMQPMLVSGCLARLTRARTSELAELLVAE